MSLNATPAGERVHIAFFGRRNAGKSSLVNAFTGQDLAIVSDVKGTTTDPVYKAMELLPLGPVQIIDTPGIDDEGELGELRVKKTRQVLNKTDLAILVADATQPLGKAEEELLALIQDKGIPYLLAWNKADLLDSVPEEGENTLWVSALTGLHIHELKEKAARLAGQEGPKRPLIADLLQPGDTVVLVVPIDKAAPKGRLILPQQQTIRDVLEAGASALVCRNTELALTLAGLPKSPRLVVTDSQAFAEVAKIVPREVPLTSFSILMARYKGTLDQSAAGAAQLDRLQDGDKVLLSEGCTHHRQCEDIGTVKIPRWLREYTGKDLVLEHSSGRDFPEDLSPYRLIIHCGGCMLGEREMAYRQKTAQDAGVPFTNYGMAIAQMHGILQRSLEPLAAARREQGEQS